MRESSKNIHTTSPSGQKTCGECRHPNLSDWCYKKLMGDGEPTPINPDDKACKDFEPKLSEVRRLNEDKVDNPTIDVNDAK